MTNPKEVLEYIQHKRELKTKPKRELAILAFDKLIKDARREFCCRTEHCYNCIYRIDSESADYIDAADGKNCYARRFHEEATALLMKKEGIQ